MTTPTDADRSLITVFALMRAKEGQQDELRHVLEGLVAASRTEDGFVTYDLHQGLDDPRTFCFYENWTSRQALAAHAASATQDAFRARHSDLVEDGSVVHVVQRIA